MAAATAAAPGDRVEIDGWIYVRLEGGPRTRGRQHGQALAKELLYALDIGDYMARWDTGDGLMDFAESVDEAFGPLDEEYEEEIRGIVDGVTAAGPPITPGGIPVTRDVLVAWNGYSELLGNWWPAATPGASPSNAVRTKGGLEHCSAFIAMGGRTDGGKIVMAHNTWDRYAIGDSYNIILDIVPPPGDGHRMLMQAGPGYITSNMDWVVTDAGLMITETTIGSFSGFKRGLNSEFQRSRHAAQYSTSISEWCDRMLTRNNGGYANTWLLGETKNPNEKNGRKIARFDLGLKFHGYEETTDGYYSGYNVAADLRVRNQECSDPGAYSDIRGNGARRVRFDQLLKDATGLTAVKARDIISDHHDVFTGMDKTPCSRTICGHLELDDARIGNHGQGPFYPWGANDGKVMDSDMAAAMTFEGRWGNSCGTPFSADDFVKKHRQYDWLEKKMKNRPGHSWVSLPPHH